MQEAFYGAGWVDLGKGHFRGNVSNLVRADACLDCYLYWSAFIRFPILGSLEVSFVG